MNITPLKLNPLRERLDAVRHTAVYLREQAKLVETILASNPLLWEILDGLTHKPKRWAYVNDMHPWYGVIRAEIAPFLGNEVNLTFHVNIDTRILLVKTDESVLSSVFLFRNEHLTFYKTVPVDFVSYLPLFHGQITDNIKNKKYLGADFDEYQEIPENLPTPSTASRSGARFHI